MCIIIIYIRRGASRLIHNNSSVLYDIVASGHTSELPKCLRICRWVRLNFVARASRVEFCSASRRGGTTRDGYAAEDSRVEGRG